MNSAASSACDQTVATSMTLKMPQRTGSRLLVPRARRYAAIAMMAMTTAPMP